jgi:ankyrin repeat protein
MTPLQLEIKLKNYCDIPTQANLEKLIEKLSNLPRSTLIEYCIENKTIRQLLAQADFQPLWQQKLAEIKFKTLADFRFQETTSLNAFELTLGYYNYFQALKDPQQQTKYIQEALTLHSYQALHHYAEELILQFNDKKESLKLTVAALPFFEKEAVWHGTPAYLLVALLYYRLALAYKPLNQDRARNAFQLVIKNLEFAILAEKNSSAEHNNAYFGQAFAEANPFNQPSLEAIKHECIKQAGSCLNQTDINFVIQAASLNFPGRKIKSTTNTQSSLSKIQLAILADSPEAIALARTKEIETINSWGETSLLFAARHGKINSVRYFLALGANPEGSAALQLALAIEHLGISRLLINHIYSLHSSDNENSFMSKAVEDNNTTLIRSLLENGASPDLILPNGKTALETLVTMKNHEGIALLLNFGVSLTNKNCQGEPILFSLLETDKKFIAEAKVYFRRFVGLGADINAQNEAGETMLSKAVKRGDLNAVIFLLAQEGINLHLVDKIGQSALNYAEIQNNQWIIALLRQPNRENTLKNSEGSAAEKYQSTRFFVQPFAAPEPLQATATLASCQK